MKLLPKNAQTYSLCMKAAQIAFIGLAIGIVACKGCTKCYAHVDLTDTAGVMEQFKEMVKEMQDKMNHDAGLHYWESDGMQGWSDIDSGRDISPDRDK